MFAAGLRSDDQALAIGADWVAEQVVAGQRDLSLGAIQDAVEKRGLRSGPTRTIVSIATLVPDRLAAQTAVRDRPLTDIHHQGFIPGRMSDHGEHGEEAPAAPFVHPGVQGGDRRAVPARGPVGRSGREGLRPDRDRGAGVGQAGRARRRDRATAGLTSDERQELAELRRENRRLREDVDILKRATAFFAKETR